HYIFSFILLLLLFLLGRGEDGLGWRVFDWLIALVTLCWPVHLYLAMRRFYGQGWGKTLGKFLLLNFMGMFVLGILFTLFIVISFLM
ncbi:MAG TPA: hypothetical protein VHK69_14560, partial [Chitinophagaceae bacterium]|nr:hypothetical protein [Chitinophagaceae bacterium]